MAQSEIGTENSDGTYKFDPGYKWFILLGGGLVALFFLVSVMVVDLPPGITLGTVLLTTGLIAAITKIFKRSRCTVHISNERIVLQNARGLEVSSLCWSELATVAATHKMAQLVLQDSERKHQVVVDRNLENFPRIRERILTEYAKVFKSAPLPIEFRRSNFWTADGIASIGAAVVFGGMSLSVFRKGQPETGLVIFFVFETLIALYFLSINPQFFGASQLFDDRIELQGLIRRRIMYKKDVKDIEMVDFVAGRSGTSTMVVISSFDKTQLKILQRYGSPPEIYLTLRAWLAQ